MIPIQISLDPDVYEQAEKVAHRQGITLTEFCRRTLSETFVRYPKDKPWIAYVGSLEGRANDSCSVDGILYGRKAR